MEVKILKERESGNLEKRIIEYIIKGFDIHWNSFTTTGGAGYGIDYLIIVTK